jgi:hypothetical protein
MSDARNSSGNIRGGGARQTGGAGRTSKAAGGGGAKKGGDIAGLTTAVTDKKLLARRNLQLLTMSKKLAIEAKEAIFEEHTEEEYKELNIPIPDPDSAMKKLRKMTKFTDDWHDADFRARFLKSVLNVWRVELREQFEAAAKAKKANDEGRAKWERDKKMRAEGKNVHGNNDNGASNSNSNSNSNGDNNEGPPMSTEELEAMLEDVNLSGEERKKIKKKLKKRKQKAKKKNW